MCIIQEDYPSFILMEAQMTINHIFCYFLIISDINQSARQSWKFHYLSITTPFALKIFSPLQTINQFYGIYLKSLSHCLGPLL